MFILKHHVDRTAVKNLFLWGKGVGEPASPDHEAAAIFLVEFMNIGNRGTYEPEKNFNGHETGLF